MFTIEPLPPGTDLKAAVAAAKGRLANPARRLSAAESPATQVARSAETMRQATAGTLLELPTPTTVAQEQALAERAGDYGQTYVVDSASVAPSSPTQPQTAAAGKDYTSLDQCISRGAATEPAGWHKNHWAWCQTSPWHIANMSPLGPVGEAFYQTTLVGRGYPDGRKITVDQYITEVAVVGSWPKGPPVVFAQLPWKGAPAAKHCKVTGARTFTLRDNVTNHGRFTLTSSADNAEGSAKVSTAVFRPRFIISGVSGGTTEGFQQGFRCDSASYLGSKGACIFDRVTARFQLRRSDKAVAGAAAHIWLVFHSPEKVYPGKNKAIPHKLRRLYNAKDQAKNRSVALAACKKKWPKKPAGKDCDEYPFAATRQGAARANGKFSVRYVNSAQNQTAGRRVGAWYQQDRILDNDFFVVEAK